MVITIPSLKSGDTLFIALGDNANGKKLQNLLENNHRIFHRCINQKNRTKRGTVETGEAAGVVRVLCFHGTFLQL